MSIAISFMGFRHAHILGLYDMAKSNCDLRITGACEEDADTREQLSKNGDVEITHLNYIAMLNDVDCDVVAVGDYYGKRGQIIIEALKHGKHVISDKPICTNMEELESIERLATENRLQVGCQLDLRDAGRHICVRDLIRSGAIGGVQSVIVYAQHPLSLGYRPKWYFEEGKYGGTINDIGIHVFDLVEWMTQLKFNEVVSARCWNAFAVGLPCMRDGGQFMMKMENDCGVIGDVSYFLPDDIASGAEQYWRITIFGSHGVIETSYNSPTISLAANGPCGVQQITPSADENGGYLDSFLSAIGGDGNGCNLTTAEVIRASRIALTAQHAADTGDCHIAL